MEFNKPNIALGAFILGLLVAGIFFTLQGSTTGFIVQNDANLDTIPSPSDTLNESSFLLYKDKLIIKVDNASLAVYKDTGSMLPFLTNYSHGIRVKPQAASDILVGDIISFTQNNQTIVHRVIRISQDENGMYFVTKGDNSIKADPIKIRFEQIEWKIIGILY